MPEPKVTDDLFGSLLAEFLAGPGKDASERSQETLNSFAAFAKADLTANPPVSTQYSREGLRLVRAKGGAIVFNAAPDNSTRRDTVANFYRPGGSSQMPVDAVDVFKKAEA